MVENASPKPSDVYLEFNGRDADVEIPRIAGYSVSTTGELTISAWLRPDTLNFPSIERNSDYIHWLGKRDRSGDEGNHEWAFRMYNHCDPLGSPFRPNRISFYLFNRHGGLGVGSYGKWIHVVGVADRSRTDLYKDDQYIRCDTYHAPAQGPCEIHCQVSQPEFASRYRSAGRARPLRLGTKDFGSFFEGGVRVVRRFHLDKHNQRHAEVIATLGSDSWTVDGSYAPIEW
jgi:hypothetical protein